MGKKPILSRIYEDIVEGNTKGKEPLDIGSSITTGNINIIPARFKGECCNILVTICYDGDNFDERFRNFLDHASIT